MVRPTSLIPCCSAPALLLLLFTQVSSLPTLTINTNANGTCAALRRLSFVLRGVVGTLKLGWGMLCFAVISDYVYLKLLCNPHFPGGIVTMWPFVFTVDATPANSTTPG